VDGQDVRDPELVAAAVRECAGVVHLAAVSRVVWGQLDPQRCESTNIEGTDNVVSAAEARGAWVLFASSREVYGEPRVRPVPEVVPLRPLNVYARSKVAGEQRVAAARAAGLPAAVVRLSNVYGDPRDHVDRVIPAFCRAALADDELRVDGSGHTFDFVHLDDAVAGLLSVIERLESGVALPPAVHLVTGVGTTLGELADRAMALAGGGCRREAPPRDYDVTGFVGDPTLAAEQLGWRAQVPLDEGLHRLLRALRA
jgi:nucleoside-diphosphate-sugar epimerase